MRQCQLCPRLSRLLDDVQLDPVPFLLVHEEPAEFTFGLKVCRQTAHAAAVRAENLAARPEAFGHGLRVIGHLIHEDSLDLPGLRLDMDDQTQAERGAQGPLSVHGKRLELQDPRLRALERMAQFVQPLRIVITLRDCQLETIERRGLPAQQPVGPGKVEMTRRVLRLKDDGDFECFDRRGIVPIHQIAHSLVHGAGRRRPQGPADRHVALPLPVHVFNHLPQAGKLVGRLRCGRRVHRRVVRPGVPWIAWITCARLAVEW